MNSPIIQVNHLTKHYQVTQKASGFLNSLKSLIKRQHKTVKAVQDINFQLNQSELVGFIGPNGAGKTTTLKLLSGLLYPDKGQVQVLGFDPWDRKPQFQKQFALVMGQKNQLFWDLPANESFLLLKDIYEIPQKKYQQNFTQLVDMLDVSDLLDTPLRKLSLGQRMKMELIGSLLHSPKVLFLDEPTIGLDVIMQKKIREFIKTYNQESQATIILTSHYMEDVRRLCKRVIVIDQGKIAYDGNLKKLIRKHAPQKYLKITFSQPTTPAQLKPLGSLLKHQRHQATIRVDRKKVSSTAVKILKNFSVEDLTIEEPRIQDVISRVFNQHQT